MDPQNTNFQQVFMPHQPPAPITPFQIVLIKQTSLAEETVSKNGLTIPYHVVVKGAPFLVTLRLNYAPEYRMNQPKHLISFHNLALEVTLLYDCETLKEVAFLKNKPVTFKPAVSEDGMEVTCQCRLKVLTSQHEGSFFRVRIRAKPPPAGNKHAYPFYQPIDVITAPYKVISKPEQLKARQQQTKIATSSNSASGKKRSITEMLYDTVARLEKQQLEHQRMLEHLVTTGVLPQQFLSFDASSASHDGMSLSPPSSSPIRTSSNGLSTTTTTTTTATMHAPLSFLGEHNQAQLDVHKELELAELFDLPVGMEGKGKEKESDKCVNDKDKQKEQEMKDKEGETFEDLFLRCMKAYAAIDPDQRPAKIRRVMRNATTKQTEEVNEFVDLVYAEGLGRNIGGVDFLTAFATGNNSSSAAASSTPFNISSLTSLMGGNGENTKPTQPSDGGETTCNCAHCPHKMELEKIDQFYSEFLN